ncbi:MAG: toll/interleukin-1 receptor domain-containing protein [Cyanobacteria bacterium P01_C01_bin.120]
MPKIFISYRRSDSEDVAGRIYDRLINHFGKGNVFKDVDDIPFGVDFRDYLNASLDQCQIVLAVIGKTWLTATDDSGRRRLDNPADWVRLELEESLRRRDVLVVPLLVRRASLP